MSATVETARRTGTFGPNVTRVTPGRHTTFVASVTGHTPSVRSPR